MPKLTQFTANIYLRELIEIIREQFPETAKDEEKLIGAISRFYSPASCELVQKK